ncbi:uncharacterized protein LOC112679683 [Sipha flava]|uniref:Uncharacterized protein LOC112679683 n=1 Tax=Sipha flava TaxID=143950 RepID=A0A2S2PWJ5_9HEMI|nr:uncharacterized protein LOC112679683 [Sipha flava]
MKSDGPVLTFCVFVCVIAVAVPLVTGSTYFGGTTGVVQGPGFRRDPLMAMYKAIYCRNKQCPNWRCQDDSAMIHGHCCGCHNSFEVNVPVLCVEDLKCPLKMKNLCDDYHFMITCCCS